MKKIALLISFVLFTGTAYADTCATVLMPAFGAQAADTLCGKLGRAFRTDFGFAAGKTISIQEGTAASACSGSVTANGTTPVVITTTCSQTGQRLFLTKTSTSAVNGSCYQSALSNGVSTTITCLATDTGTYNWLIVHEAP